MDDHKMCVHAYIFFLSPCVRNMRDEEKQRTPGLKDTPDPLIHATCLKSS